MLAGVLLKMGTYGMIDSACRFSRRLSRPRGTLGGGAGDHRPSFTARWWRWCSRT